MTFHKISIHSISNAYKLRMLNIYAHYSYHVIHSFKHRLHILSLSSIHMWRTDIWKCKIPSKLARFYFCM